MERKKKKKRQNGRSEEFYFQHLLLMSLQLDEGCQHGICQNPDNCPPTPAPDLVEVGMFREKKVRKEILCWETYLFLCVYEQTIEN